MHKRYYFVYIMANKKNGTIYVGVTNNLARRVSEHKQVVYESFTKRYEVTLLVYYEVHEDIRRAIQREKRFKKWSRKWKISLIEKMNPQWEDLYSKLCKEL